MCLRLIYRERVGVTYKNAESLFLCGLPAFVLLNGSSLALFENGVMIGKIERTGIRRRLPCNMPES